MKLFGRGRIALKSNALKSVQTGLLLDLNGWPADYSGSARFQIENCRIEAVPGGGIKVTPLDC